MTQKKKKEKPKSAAVIHSLSGGLILPVGRSLVEQTPSAEYPSLRAAAPVLGSGATTAPFAPPLSPQC